MRYTAIGIFVLGIAAYIAALFNMSTSLGEIFSDIGTALLLVSANVMLFAQTLSRRVDGESPSQQESSG